MNSFLGSKRPERFGKAYILAKLALSAHAVFVAPLWPHCFIGGCCDWQHKFYYLQSACETNWVRTT